MKKDKSDEILNWNKADIERRFGLPSGGFTTPGWIGPIISGGLLAGAFWVLLLGLGLMPQLSHLFGQGYELYPISFLTTTAMVFLLIKWVKIRLQTKPLKLKPFNDLIAFLSNWDELTPEHAKDIVTGMRKLVDDPDRFMLFSRIKEALSTFRFVGVPEDVAKVLRSKSAEDAKQVDSGYLVVTMVIWLIPLLGVSGTVWNLYLGFVEAGLLGNSGGSSVFLAQSGQSDVMDLVPLFLLSLEVPFAGMAVALTLSLLIQIAVSALKKRDFMLLDACDEYCYLHITQGIQLSFGDRLEQIRFRVTRRRSPKALDRLWKSLENDDVMDDEEARDHLWQSFEKARKKVSSRRTGRWIGLTFVFVLVVVSSGASYRLGQLSTDKSEITHQLMQAFQANDFSRIRKLQNEIEAQYASLFSAIEMAHYRSKTNQLEAGLTVQSNAFYDAIQKLEEIKNDQFQSQSDPETIETLLNDANAHLKVAELLFYSRGNPSTATATSEKVKHNNHAQTVSASSPQQRYSDIVTAWEEKKFGVTSESKTRITNILERLKRSFQVMGDPTSPDLSSGEEQLQRISSLIFEGAAIDNVTPDMKDELEAFRPRLKSLLEIWNKRRDTLSSLSNSETLDGYFNKLEGFRQTFPNDGVSDAITGVQAQLYLYRQFITVPELSKEIMSKRKAGGDIGEKSESKTKMDKTEKSGAGGADGKKSGHNNKADGAKGKQKKEIESENFDEKAPENLFWQKIVNENRIFESHFARYLPEAMENIKRIEQIHFFTNLWECTVKKPNQDPETWYFMGKPTQTFIRGVKSYAGGAYAPAMTDLQPKFSEMHVVTVHVEEMKPSPHCQLVKEMMGRIADDPSLERLLKEMHQFNSHPLSPILKLDVLKYFVKPLTLMAGREHAEELGELADLFEKSTLKHHWLCNRHPKYEEESGKATAIVNDILAKSNGVGDYMLKMKLGTISLDRFPRWIGYVDLENSGKLHFKSGERPKEVWVLRDASPPQVLVAKESLSGEAMMSYSDHGAYLPGEPLFAPGGEKTTWEVIDDLAADLREIPGRRDGSWPLGWPVNARFEN